MHDEDETKGYTMNDDHSKFPSSDINFFLFQREKNLGDKFFLSTTGSNCGTMTPYGLLRTPNLNQFPSPLGYGVIFKHYLHLATSLLCKNFD
jgi:hypothetical protein